MIDILRFLYFLRLYHIPHTADKTSGAGGSRTLVQTGKPYAFYMLIPAFIFVLRQDPDHQPQPYPLKLHHADGAQRDYSRFNCTA